MLASSARAVFDPPYGGPQLGEIFDCARLKQALEDHGLTIAPVNPTRGMRRAFREGWFRPFADRYAAMLKEAWVTWDCRNETDESRFGMPAPAGRKKSRDLD
jgi:hypothetical protein